MVSGFLKFQFVVGLLFCLLAVQAFGANGVMKGDGSAENPFQIEDYEDLKAIGKGAYLYSLNYILTENIDASASKNEMCNEDGCNGFISIGKYKDAADSVVFWGNIDGKNHTIKNLNIWLPCENDVAFVSYLSGSITNLNFDHINVVGRITQSDYVAAVAARMMGSIKNVHVANGYVQGKDFVGGVVGLAANWHKNVLEDVSFQGEVRGSKNVGGIAGEVYGNIARAIVDADIFAAESYIGGIVGYSHGLVDSSRSSGTITPVTSEVRYVGGIAGSGTVSKCVSTMDLIHSGTYYFEKNVGGVAGFGGVEQSYAMGVVEGTENVGGVAGYGFVETSFAMGSVQGDSNVGGLVGDGTARYSYAANVVQGNANVGGAVGLAYDTVVSSYWNVEISGLDTSAGGFGLTTAEMMKFSSFVGWDTLSYEEYVVDGTDTTCLEYERTNVCHSPTGKFNRYWAIDEGQSFPYLMGNPFSIKSVAPIAVPTSASRRPEQPKVASLVEIEGELVGKWLDWARTNKSGDSLYYGYRIGSVNDGDTIWGTSSYMAVPNKIEISTITELLKIGNDVAYPLVANYELTKDIDASGFAFKPIGDSMHVFSGTFDGKNHRISNLTIENSSLDCVGMFGYTEYARVMNLTLVNTKVVGFWYVGALAGEAKQSVIHNVVSLNGDISGTSYVGGLIGAAYDDSLSVIATTGYVLGDDIVGGIIGISAARIENAFSVNVIKGHGNTAGVIGRSTESEIPTLQKNIYSASILKSYELHGIIGGSFFGYGENMESCYFDYINGENASEKMMKKDTYVGFDFENIWEIQEGISYPYFKGMDPILPGMLKDDGSVNILAGFGTEINPYKIESYDDLKLIGKHEYGLDKHYKMISHVYASSSFKENCNADSTICKGFEPIGEFSGVFDGNNKVIVALNINRLDEDSVGLFRALANSAKVKGLVFDTVSKCDNRSCVPVYDQGAIRGKNYVGTLAGVDNGADIENVFVKFNVSGSNYVGGIVGKKASGSIVGCASRDTIVGDAYIGGLFGSLGQATVKDCFSASPVSGSKDVGGLIGYSNNATVRNSYAVGNVQGMAKWGGIVGEDVKSTYTSVYCDSTLWTSKTTAAGELRTTAQMVRKENYRGWDFENIWEIASDITYPYLVWLDATMRRSERIRPNRNINVLMMHMVGSGTEEDPFLVKTYDDLKSIGFGKYKMSAVYKLANDIDASASATEILDGNASKGFKPIGEIEYFGLSFGDYGVQDTEPFSGKFDGNGYSINDLTMYSSHHSSPYGFIDTLAPSGVVENLTFKNYSLVKAEVGGVAGANYGVIKNVNVEATVDSTDGYGASGFVNYNKGSIENCSIKVKLNGGYNFAGIAYANDGKIVNAMVDVFGNMNKFAGVALVNGGLIDKASVTAKVVSESGFMAGLVGLNRKTGSISASSAMVDMTSKNGGAGYAYYLESLYQNVYVSIEGVGGLVGVDSGSVTGSTASGVIDAPHSYYVGGLIGAVYDGDLKDLHASVDVTGYDYVGGFVGFNNVKISNSYATGDVVGRGHYSVGGFVGRIGRTGVVEKSFATGNVVGRGAFSEGGFVGLIDSAGVVEKSFATGDVGCDDCSDGAAGFVGYNYGMIRRSYSTGNVMGNATFAVRNASIIEDCYAVGDLYLKNKNVYPGAFVYINGRNSSVKGYASGAVFWENDRMCGSEMPYSVSMLDFYYLADNCVDSLLLDNGLLSSEMYQQKSFDAFDFDSVWYIKEGVTYPLLRDLPNVPFAGSTNLAYSDGNIDVEKISVELLDNAFVMDSSYRKVVKFDSTSEMLLDSLEKVGDKVVGEFEIGYRVGMLLDQDTIWSALAHAKLNLNRNIGVRMRDVAAIFGFHFGVKLDGGLVVVHFEIPAAGVVKFSLVDIQGRVLKTADLGQRAAGSYFETLDVAELGRGRYFGVLQVDGKTVEKAVLLKK